MIQICRIFIRRVDALNRRLGRVIMYGIFALMAVLLWSSISKTFFLPSLWTLEMAQFIMVAYYILGGTLFNSIGLRRADGLVLWWLVAAQESVV
jgi:TRAP-type C4-dicarboxylate transport system permease small subunit